MDDVSKLMNILKKKVEQYEKENLIPETLQEIAERQCYPEDHIIMEMLSDSSLGAVASMIYGILYYKTDRRKRRFTTSIVFLVKETGLSVEMVSIYIERLKTKKFISVTYRDNGLYSFKILR